MEKYKLKDINIIKIPNLGVDGLDVTYSISYTDSRGDEKTSKEGTLFIPLNKLPNNFNELTNEQKEREVKHYIATYITNSQDINSKKSQKPKNTLGKKGYNIKTFKKTEGGDLEVIFEKEVPRIQPIPYVRFQLLNPVTFNPTIYHHTIIIPKNRVPETPTKENLLPIANEIFREKKRQEKEGKSERVPNRFSEILVSCGLGSCVGQVKNGDN